MVSVFVLVVVAYAAVMRVCRVVMCCFCLEGPGGAVRRPCGGSRLRKKIINGVLYGNFLTEISSHVCRFLVQLQTGWKWPCGLA